MKRNLHLMLLLAAAWLGAASVSATTYCHTELTQGTNTIYLSCEKLSVGNYRLTIEGENLAGLGGTFYNPGAVDIRTTITTTTDTKIVCTIAADSDPVIYNPLYVMMPGEVNFGEIKDIEWGTCGDGEKDTKAPVMESAAFVSATYNSALVSVSATPADSIALYQVQSGDTKIGSFAPKDGQITITGLASGTAYTLQIYAVKTTGLLSENYKEVSFSTESLTYCAFPTGHLGDANFGDPAGRILLTLSKKSDTSVGVKVVTNGGAIIDWYQIIINGTAKVVGTKNSGTVVTTELVFDGLTSLDFTCNVFWHTPALGEGQWAIDPFNVTASQLCTDSTTAVEQVETTATPSRKLLRNGQLLIVRDGICYTAIGTVVE